MINLTSLEDLITSLISKFLGNNLITFTVYTKINGSILFECMSNDYKFVISKKENGIRVYDNGDIYLIPNIFTEYYLNIKADEKDDNTLLAGNLGEFELLPKQSIRCEIVSIQDKIDELIRREAETLNKYYKLDFYVDKINRDTEANVYRFVKVDIN
jgi:hypothetical protein